MLVPLHPILDFEAPHRIETFPMSVSSPLPGKFFKQSTKLSEVPSFGSKSFGLAAAILPTGAQSPVAAPAQPFGGVSLVCRLEK